MYDNNASACLLNVAKSYRGTLKGIRSHLNGEMGRLITLHNGVSEEAALAFTKLIGGIECTLEQLDRIITVYEAILPF